MLEMGGRSGASSDALQVPAEIFPKILMTLRTNGDLTHSIAKSTRAHERLLWFVSPRAASLTIC